MTIATVLLSFGSLTTFLAVAQVKIVEEELLAQKCFLFLYLLSCFEFAVKVHFLNGA